MLWASFGCKGQRRFDRSRVPSATYPREIVLPIWRRPDFFVVFEGYAGEAVNWPCCPEGQKRSLNADIVDLHPEVTPVGA